MILTKKVAALIRENGYVIDNVDITIIAQRPKLAPYTEEMRANVAEVLGVNISDVNVKATTTESSDSREEERG